MSITDELKKHIINSGLTADKISKLSGVPGSRISEIVNGKTTNPRMQTVEKLANALKITVNSLLSSIEDNQTEYYAAGFYLPADDPLAILYKYRSQYPEATEAEIRLAIKRVQESEQAHDLRNQIDKLLSEVEKLKAG